MRKFAVALVVLAIGLSGSTADAGKLVFKEGVTTTAKVPKPELSVFVSRQNLDKAYDLELKESFLGKIIDSVGQDPL